MSEEVTTAHAQKDDGKYDHYNRLTDIGWNQLRARIAAAVQTGGSLDAIDMVDLDKVIKALEDQMSIRIMANAYNYLVGERGKVLGLTAGDQFYEPTGLELDMSGWHAIDDSIDPNTIGDDASWLKAWQWCNRSTPANYEVVVTKTPDGNMAYDWLEPGRHRDKGVGEIAYYADNLGTAQFWMPKETFERLAPKWAKDQVAPLNGQPNPPAAVESP